MAADQAASNLHPDAAAEQVESTAKTAKAVEAAIFSQGCAS